MTCNGFIELVVHLYLSSFDVKTEQVDGGVAHREEDAGEGEALEPDGGDSGDDAVADGDENDVLLMVFMLKMSLMMMEMVVLTLVMLMLVVMVVLVMVIVMVRGKYKNL